MCTLHAQAKPKKLALKARALIFSEQCVSNVESASTDTTVAPFYFHIFLVSACDISKELDTHISSMHSLTDQPPPTGSSNPKCSVTS